MITIDLPTSWGRWGDGDQLGSLHLIDARARARVMAGVVGLDPKGRRRLAIGARSMARRGNQRR